MANAGFYLFSLFARLLSFLPIRILYILSDLIFLPVYYLIRYRRKVVFQNLRNAFPSKNEKELRAAEKKFYRHLVDVFFETIKIPGFSQNELNKRVTYRNLELLKKYHREGKSVVTMLGHYGNWEWHAGFSRWSPHKPMAVYKRLSSKNFDKWILTIRSRFGAELIPSGQIIRKLFRYRQEEKLVNCAFLADQSPQLHNTHHWQNFMNQETLVFLTAEKIARRFDIPVVYMKMEKLRRGYYRVEIKEITGDPSKQGMNAITETFFRLLEEQITQRPELWLWSHRRWRYNKQIWAERLKSIS
jgi:Kdo2-lipid IVA lauroyltransferase/acyltransferase